MKMRPTMTIAHPGHDRERGFTMIEMVIVVIIIILVSAMAIVQFGPSLRNSRADTAQRQMIDQLRQAREYAIANRRFVQVSFPIAGGQYQIQIKQMNTLTAGAGAVNPVLSTIPIQAPLQYYVFPALPDTPDGFGKAAAIYFGGVNGGPPGGMYFRSDGELINAATNLPINGTVFLGVPGDATSARAITVLGTTGRVRGWNCSSGAWKQL